MGKSRDAQPRASAKHRDDPSPEVDDPPQVPGEVDRLEDGAAPVPEAEVPMSFVQSRQPEVMRLDSDQQRAQDEASATGSSLGLGDSMRQSLSSRRSSTSRSTGTPREAGRARGSSREPRTGAKAVANPKRSDG